MAQRAHAACAKPLSPASVLAGDLYCSPPKGKRPERLAPISDDGDGAPATAEAAAVSNLTAALLRRERTPAAGAEPTPKHLKLPARALANSRAFPRTDAPPPSPELQRASPPTLFGSAASSPSITIPSPRPKRDHNAQELVADDDFLVLYDHAASAITLESSAAGAATSPPPAVPWCALPFDGIL